MSDDRPSALALQIVRGAASAEDVAAVLAVLSAAGAPDGGGSAPRRSSWGAPRLRREVHAAPGGWVRSQLPG